jgi:hypothetical protein
MRQAALLLTGCLLRFLSCDAFLDSSQIVSPLSSRRADIYAIKSTEKGPKIEYLESLDHLDNFNAHSPTRSQLLQKLVDFGSIPGGGNISKPGKAFASVAEGSWKVVYAPHMTMFANLLMV